MTASIDPFRLLALVALLLALTLVVVLWLAARGRKRAVADAHAQGRASREAEQVALAHERDAQASRAQELAQRLAAADAELRHLRERADVLSDERAALAVQAERSTQFETRAAHLDGELRRALEARAAAATRVAELETRLQEQQQATELRLREFDERLKAELAQLAQGVLEEKTRHFDERSEKQLGTLLGPLRDQLAQFNQSITRTNAEILSLKTLNQQITAEAANLARALKGDSRSQGAWGELALERLLEISGLQAGRAFHMQVVYKGEDGGRPRPDVIVRLPDEKDLVIDAKVSLTAWDRAVASIDDAPREQAMKEHIGSLRRHIDDLGKRDYSAVPDVRTLDFVLMFVPVEAAYIEALRRDDSLYGYALERNIALVSPSTLLATLRTVAHLWKLEDRNLNAREIARQAGALHDAFVMLEGELIQVGEQIGRAQRSHEAAVRRISTGRGNLVGRVERLRKLGADARKRLATASAESEDEGEPEASAAKRIESTVVAPDESAPEADASPSQEQGG